LALPLLLLSTLNHQLSTGFAATTINSANRFAYGANIGWMDWRGDTNNGAVIGEFVCSGYIYAANVGWIHLGDGTPANTVSYQNNSATDYGVNHDGAGNLRGFGYGANIGWVNFENQGAPRLDLKTGKFSGFAYGANVGWISLSNAYACVQTDLLQPGPDTDGDGIPDAWETARGLNPADNSDAALDSDGDGETNLEEYGADTDPFSSYDLLHVKSLLTTTDGTMTDLTWLSVTTRCYQVQLRLDLTNGMWTNSSLGLFLPDPGTNTTRTVPEGPASNRFFRVQAVKPLAP
jgi:hypothetical protein